MLVSAFPEALCLDFANTRCWRGRARPVETLGGFADLLDWCGRSGAIGETALAEARLWAQVHGDEADRVFAEAVSLREVIYRLFAAIALGNSANLHDVDAFNAFLAAAPPRRRLGFAPSGYAWSIDEPGHALPDLLAPILWSAADLAVAAPARPIRRCANEECLWLFIDRSKTGTRRWCDMGSCGNRAKARRHYARLRVP